MATVLSWINLADAAEEITATREATGLGVRNLLTEPIAEVWRVPNVAAATNTRLDITLASAQEMQVLALFAPRDSYLPPGYQITVRASAVALGYSEALLVGAADMDLEAGRGAWWYLAAAPFTARYIRLTFTAGADDEYLQLGRLWLGAVFQPAIGADLDGYRRGWLDAGVTERAAISGIANVQRGATYRAPAYTLGMLDQDEADTLEDISAAVGTTGQLISNPRSERGARDLVIGRLAQPIEPEAVLDATLFRATIAMQEDL